MSSAPQPVSEAVIVAAGGVLLRTTESSEQQICIVLRRKRKDWTLPKGKVERNESFQDAARREVQEETGWNNELSEYLGAISYKVDGSPKVVLFWCMTPTNESEFLKKEEIIKPEWVSIQEALSRLTYKAERDFLARIMGKSLEAVRPGYSWLDKLFHLRRARARLARECEVFSVELGFLEARSKCHDDSWVRAARQLLSAAKRYQQAGEIEGGWVCLHAAQRQTLFGLERDELICRAESLRREVKKPGANFSAWRVESIETSLQQEDQITAERVKLAMALRDEHFANQYHKIWLTGDQLRILIGICGPAFFFLVLCIGFNSQLFSSYSTADAWKWPTLLAVLLFGLLGASFSCAQALIGDAGSRSVPQRMTDHYVTVTRVFSGAIIGLASHVFFISGAFTIKGLENSIGAAFTVAYIFGYTGEKLVARVANSGSDKIGR